MFHAYIDIKLTCPAHPDYDPLMEAPTKKCRCCQSIMNVSQWISLASRSSAKIQDGFYNSQAEEPAEVMPTVEEIADVAPEAPAVVEKVPAKKQAIATQVQKAPVSLFDV